MKGRAIPYLPQEMAWIEARKDMPRRELHALFCTFWDRDDISLGAFKNLCKRKGWMTGRTGCFEKGTVPANKGKKMPFNAASAATRFKKGQRSGRAKALHKPIGTERWSKGGYLERKIHDGLPLQSRWRAVHVIRWEEVNGPVPQGCVLKCLDSDRSNTDPQNWRPIPRAMLPRLNGRWTGVKYDDAQDELKPTIMAVAELDHAAKTKRKT